MQPDFGEGQPHVEKFRLRWELLDEEALVPPSGAVLYHQKRQPIHQTEEVEEDARPFIFTRGSADVSGISAKLDAGGEDIWSEATARAENVHLLRPSHDSWGIRKIIFCFADDFLQRCYRFPLWRDPEWRALLDPIFAAAGIAPSQVVRCLIASMPPRTVIPVHHDTGLRQSLVVSRISRVKQGPHVETSTGYWVKHTHRVHCAIRTDAKVVFRVGPDEENLLRFQLAPGEVVELNNQAKHFVTNFWDEYRSHLIFDFVDEAAPADLRFPRMPEIDVAVGDELVQTRRSIDLRRDEGTGISPPHFLIIGAQKAGTTSMYEYICQHPCVIKGKRRETHFLDWRWQTRLQDPDDQWRWWAHFFDEEAHRIHPSLRAGDSTPSYLLASHAVIPRLQRMLQASGRSLPFIVMLRDPTARAISHYKMVTDPAATPSQRKTRGTAWLETKLADLVDADIAALADAGVLPGRQSNEIDWDRYEKLYLQRVPNNHGSHSLVARGLYALQLRPWIEAFGREAFVFVRCEDLSSAEMVQAEVDRCIHHIGLRAHPLESTAPSNTRSYGRVPDEIVERLQAFYEPFNRELYDLLGWPDEKRWEPL